MTKSTYKTARRRYRRANIVLMVLYVIAISGGTFYLKTLEVEPLWLQISIAFATAGPLVLYLMSMLRYFSETDEYNRALHLKAFSYGAVFTVSMVFIIGALQMFDVIESFEIFWLGILFFFSYGLSHKFLGGKDRA